MHVQFVLSGVDCKVDWEGGIIVHVHYSALLHVHVLSGSIFSNFEFIFFYVRILASNKCEK